MHTRPYSDSRSRLRSENRRKGYALTGPSSAFGKAQPTQLIKSHRPVVTPTQEVTILHLLSLIIAIIATSLIFVVGVSMKSPPVAFLVAPLGGVVFSIIGLTISTRLNQ